MIDADQWHYAHDSSCTRRYRTLRSTLSKVNVEYDLHDTQKREEECLSRTRSLINTIALNSQLTHIYGSNIIKHAY